MTETELAAFCAAITPPDEAARAAAHAHWASLAKPLGGLGGLETTIEDAAALTGSAKLDISRRAVLVLDCRIAPGTADFTLGPAMSRAEAVEAIGRGIRLVQEQKKAGVGLLATGEMGIGNTTTSSAVAAVLLGQPVEGMTGRGAGLSDEGLARKIDAIHRGIAKNQPDSADALDVLAKLGGFDIAGLCGVFLGGALEGVPVLADGFISCVAALCAVRLCPAAAKAVFASHCSTEPAAKLVLDALNKKALITAGLHLGEGTGAVAAIPLWDMALAVYDGCYSFEEGGIEAYTPQGGAGC